MFNQLLILRSFLFSFLAFLALSLAEFASSAAITGKFSTVGDDYVCSIEKQSYHKDDKVLKMYGKHLKGKSFGNVNVTIVDASHKGNNLQLIPNTVCHLFGRLREMKMEAVNLKLLNEKSFQSCSNLNTLLLAEDHIESISADTFKPCGKLQVLVFNRNAIDMLDNDAFTGLSALRSLTLRGNQIRNLVSAWFIPLTELTHLTIAENPIVELPDDLFFGQKSLAALDLSSNELNYLPSFLFHDKEKLESADLNGNAIQSIDYHLLEKIPFHLTLNLLSNECINKTFNHIGSDEVPLISVAGELEVCFSKDPERLKVQELFKSNATEADYSIESDESESSEDVKGESNKSDVFDKLDDDGTYGGIFDDKYSPKPRDQDTNESLSTSDESKIESSTSGDKNFTKLIETEGDTAGDASVNVKGVTEGEDDVNANETSSSTSTNTSSEESYESFDFSFETQEDYSDAFIENTNETSKNSTSLIDIVDASLSKNSSSAIDSATSTPERESFDGANKTASIDDFKAIDSETSANETVPLDAGKEDNKDLNNRTKESIEGKVSEIDHSFNETIDASDKNQTLSSQNKTQTPVAGDVVQKVAETEVKPRPVHAHEQATSRCYLNAKKEYVAVVKGAKKFLKHIITKHDDGFTDENVTVVYVTESSLQHIPKAIFETFPNVKKLSVERCGIKIMDAELFEVCGSLEFLDLSSNRIRVMAGNSLKMCPLLKFVDISGNPIETIESSIFECNPKLNITLGSFKLVST